MGYKYPKGGSENSLRGGVILNPTPMFRFQGVNVFLTYAQAERIETKESLRDALRAKNPTPTAWAIGREQHADGGIHYHVLLRYGGRINIRDQRHWDVEGHHPNIQAARSRKRVLEYVTKEGDTLIYGFDGAFAREEDIFDVLSDEIVGNTDATTVIKNTITRTGTKGLRMYNQIAGYTDRIMKPSAKHDPIKAYPEEFNITDPILEGHITKFLDDMDMGPNFRGDRKSLWIYGPSRQGKTILARSLGVHWYMQQSWNVDAHDDNADYGVLDDIPWEALQRYYKGIMGIQLDVTVTDKYKKKTVITHGRPVIILTNELPTFSVAEAAWLEANVVFYFNNNKLF